MKLFAVQEHAVTIPQALVLCIYLLIASCVVTQVFLIAIGRSALTLQELVDALLLRRLWR
jgi:hypothetical protein